MFSSVRDGRLRRPGDESLMALASLGARLPRTVGHVRQPTSRVLRCAPALRVTDAADRAGSPSRASRKAGPRFTASANVCEPLRCRGAPSTTLRPWAFRHEELRGHEPGHVTEAPTRCGSKRVPARSIAQATLSRRSATERSARACPWPRLRSVRYLSWLTASRCAAMRAQW